MTDSYENLLREFLIHLKSEIEEFGTFVNITTSDQNGSIRLIVWRFYDNLISLQNTLNTKDALVSALIQRYNYELMVDFYYLIDPSGEDDKIEKFLSYKTSDSRRSWSDYDKRKKEEFLPPWIMDQKTTKPLYRKLSDMVHSNIISITLNTKGEDYTNEIIKQSISLCIVMITGCLNDQRFREMFYKYDKNGEQNSPYFETLEFQNRAINLL